MGHPAFIAHDWFQIIVDHRFIFDGDLSGPCRVPVAPRSIAAVALRAASEPAQTG